MKGWVYVISNRAMPDLVKVGFSTKDPELRAAELNHTGSPHPYLVEYELLIEAPRDIEQRVHSELSHKREAKEWFRCSAEQAVAAIKIVAGSAGLHETYKRAERAKAEAIHSAHAADWEKMRARAASAEALETQMSNEETVLRQQWVAQIQATFSLDPFWQYWLMCSVLCGFGVAGLFPKASEVAFWWAVIGGGAVAGYFLRKYIGDANVTSKKYLSLIQQRDTQIAEIRSKVIACPNCKSDIHFERIKTAPMVSKGPWCCQKCKSSVQSPWT